MQAREEAAGLPSSAVRTSVVRNGAEAEARRQVEPEVRWRRAEEQVAPGAPPGAATAVRKAWRGAEQAPVQALVAIPAGP